MLSVQFSSVQSQVMFDKIYIENIWQDFPGGSVVKVSPSSAGGAGSIPGQGAKIPHVLWPKNQNIKTEATL